MANATLTSLQKTLQEKRALVEGIASEFKDETGKGEYVISPEQHRKYLDAVNDVKEVKELIDAEVSVKAIFDWMDNQAGSSTAAADAAASRQPQRKSLGQAYLDSEVYRGIVDSNYKRLGDTFSIAESIYDLAEAKDLYSASGGAISIPGFGTAQNLGLQPRKMRPGRVRDLFPSAQTTAAMLYGMRETGFVNNARAVTFWSSPCPALRPGTTPSATRPHCAARSV